MYRVNVPRNYVATAMDLLTTDEQKQCIKDGEGVIVPFPSNDDAIAFTWLLREACGAVLAAVEVA
jgi:hypothetical protein